MDALKSTEVHEPIEVQQQEPALDNTSHHESLLTLRSNRKRPQQDWLSCRSIHMPGNPSHIDLPSRIVPHRRPKPVSPSEDGGRSGDERHTCKSRVNSAGITY